MTKEQRKEQVRRQMGGIVVALLGIAVVTAFISTKSVERDETKFSEIVSETTTTNVEIETIERFFNKVVKTTNKVAAEEAKLNKTKSKKKAKSKKSKTKKTKSKSADLSDAKKSTTEEQTTVGERTWEGETLNSINGTVQGPSGKETYYNLEMSGVIELMREEEGINYDYWVREDGVKMYGKYIMCAANLNIRPKGTIVETSLGTGMVCDTGTFAKVNPYQLDIAVSW